MSFQSKQQFACNLTKKSTWAHQIMSELLLGLKRCLKWTCLLYWGLSTWLFSWFYEFYCICYSCFFCEHINCSCSNTNFTPPSTCKPTPESFGIVSPSAHSPAHQWSTYKLKSSAEGKGSELVGDPCQRHRQMLVNVLSAVYRTMDSLLKHVSFTLFGPT